MPIKKPLSRRTFLQGSGGVALALPFLEAMLPSLASAAQVTPRMVVLYGGAPTYFGRLTIPYGALSGSLIQPIASLASVSQHVSVLMNMSLPQYAKGATPPPGGCLQQQHYTAPAPLLAGVATLESKPMMNGAHTVDQVFADAFGSTTRFKSIQARVQTLGYGYGAAGGVVCSRFQNGVTNTLAPIDSPLALYTKLFSGGVGGASAPPATTVSAQVMNRRSVLDLVLGDANRLVGTLGGQDKIRLEQHFDEIRQIENRLVTAAPPSTGAAGSCVLPNAAGADPAKGSDVLGGWSSETLRGDLMTDMIAMALACDLTRAVSLQLTFDQCGLGSINISGVNKDFHSISHDVNNDTTGVLKTAMYEHTNWHCARFARLVQKLANLQDGAGSVLDNSFLGMGFGEGASAHNRNTMHLFVAGNKSRIKLGQCINTAGEHPARMWIAGLNSLGVNTNTLGQISGPMQSLLK